MTKNDFKAYLVLQEFAEQHQRTDTYVRTGLRGFSSIRVMFTPYKVHMTARRHWWYAKKFDKVAETTVYFRQYHNAMKYLNDLFIESKSIDREKAS